MKLKLTSFTLLLLLLAGSALAQDGSAGALSGRQGYVNMGLSAGYTFDPDMATGMLSLDYFVTDELSFGPYFQLGGAGGNSFWAVTGQVRYAPALMNTTVARPYGTVGIGFTHLDFEANNDDDRDMTYLFPVGGGMEFELTDIVSMDAGALFEVTEDPFVGLVVGLRILL